MNYLIMTILIFFSVSNSSIAGNAKSIKEINNLKCKETTSLVSVSGFLKFVYQPGQGYEGLLFSHRDDADFSRLLDQSSPVELGVTYLAEKELYDNHYVLINGLIKCGKRIENPYSGSIVYNVKSISVITPKIDPYTTSSGVMLADKKAMSLEKFITSFLISINKNSVELSSSYFGKRFSDQLKDPYIKERLDWVFFSYENSFKKRFLKSAPIITSYKVNDEALGTFYLSCMAESKLNRKILNPSSIDTMTNFFEKNEPFCAIVNEKNGIYSLDQIQYDLISSGRP